MGTEQRSEAAAMRKVLAAATARSRESTALRSGKVGNAAAATGGRAATATRGGKAATAAQGGKSATVGDQRIGASVAAPASASADDLPLGTTPSFIAGRSTGGMTFSRSPSSLSAFTMGTEAHHNFPPPWMQAQNSDPSECLCRDTDPVPAGGFMNFFQNQPHFSQNAHCVGKTSHCAPFNPPRTLERSLSVDEITTPPPSTRNHNMNMDNGGVARTDKRILWTQKEDCRLMSAWLNNSLDSISGTDRRNEQYWDDVVKAYNMATPSDRQRTSKQVKDRFHKINKRVDLFHGAWLKARRLNTSGWNDEMWIKQAKIFYEDDNKHLKLGQFMSMDVWYLIRNEPKWATYNDGLKNARKRKTSDPSVEEGSEETEDIENVEIPRPIGQKAEKKAAYESKFKSKPCSKDDEDVQILKETQASRLKMMEVQQKNICR